MLCGRSEALAITKRCKNMKLYVTKLWLRMAELELGTKRRKGKEKNHHRKQLSELVAEDVSKSVIGHSGVIKWFRLVCATSPVVSIFILLPLTEGQTNIFFRKQGDNQFFVPFSSFPTKRHLENHQRGSIYIAVSTAQRTVSPFSYISPPRNTTFATRSYRSF